MYDRKARRPTIDVRELEMMPSGEETIDSEAEKNFVSIF